MGQIVNWACWACPNFQVAVRGLQRPLLAGWGWGWQQPPLAERPSLPQAAKKRFVGSVGCCMLGSKPGSLLHARRGKGSTSRGCSRCFFLSEACGQRRHDGPNSDLGTIACTTDRTGSAQTLSSKMPSPECFHPSTTKRHYTVHEQAHRSTAAAIERRKVRRAGTHRSWPVWTICTVHTTPAYSQRWEFRMPLCSEWGLPLPSSTGQAHA